MKFSDISTMEENDSTTEELPPSAASRAVAALLNDLDNGEDNQMGAAANFRVNMVVINPVDDKQELEVSEVISNYDGKIDDPSASEDTGGEVDSSALDKVAAFFEEFDAENASVTETPSAAAFIVTCTDKRPATTEDNIPGGEVDSSALDKVAAFFEELDAENASVTETPSAATFIVTCTDKRPAITEDNIPTMVDIKRGGYGS